MDQMKKKYSNGRILRRWPMSLIIYKANNEQLMLRRLYLKEISMVLVKPYITKSSAIETLNTPLRNQVALFVAFEGSAPSKKEGKCLI